MMLPSLGTIKALPKADLHSHIDGSVSAGELFKIAKRHRRKILTSSGKELESVTAFMRYVRGDGYGSLLDNIVDRFRPITGLMQTDETIREVAVSYVREQAEAGVTYVEGRFGPQYHIREGMSMRDVIASMAAGLEEGSERYGVKSRLIAGIGRDCPPSLGVKVAEAACRSGLAVALDLAGPEAGYPPERFKAAFKVATDGGLKATVHAGEGAGSLKQNLANIRTAINLLRADRLGHAVNLARDPGLMSMVREKSIVIEMNPISNLVLQNVGNIRDLEIDRLLKENILVTINSDDPSLWPKGDLPSVYASVCRAYGFGMKQLDILVENSFNGAFAPPREKEEMIELYHTARRRDG